MTRTMTTVAAMLLLAGCGGAADGDGGNVADATPARQSRPLDPDPPMSSQDIDAIVNETRAGSAARTPQAPAPASNQADAN